MFMALGPFYSNNVIQLIYDSSFNQKNAGFILGWYSCYVATLAINGMDCFLIKVEHYLLTFYFTMQVLRKVS
jgi:hypothetical protein